MIKPITILVTGAGGTPATNFIRSLKLTGKDYIFIGSDANMFYLERAETDFRYLVPKADDVENYLNALNQIISKHKVDFVHAQNDTELFILSNNREHLAAPIWLPSKETVEICQDKFRTYQVWHDNDIKVPLTYLISNKDELKKYFHMLNNKVWIRATTGAGGKGSMMIDDLDTAIAWLNYKNGWGSYTISEYLSPDSITWMSIWKNGKLIAAQGRKRLYWELSHVSPSGVTGATGSAITISDPIVDAISIAAIKSIDLKPDGIFSVDLTYDQVGVPNPTEINIGRFFTTCLFFAQAGFNMPDIFVSLALGESNEIENPILNPLPDNLVWIRGIDFMPILTTLEKLHHYLDTSINLSED
jgi:predicted ATP-grasp superfamily ATP-dependent carboligase